jgi:hypothetical protein
VAAAVVEPTAVAGELELEVGVAEAVVVVDPLAGEAPDCGREDLPLNGGIAWMNILAVGFDGAVFTAGSDEFVGFEGAATFCVVTEATRLFVAVLVGASGRRLKSVLILDGGTWVPREALAAVAAPMLRACADEASLLALSRMARCFSSSLARIGTRSSGIGLLSCQAPRNESVHGSK